MKTQPDNPERPDLPQRELDGSEIAIVGMACRFPGASGVEEFWKNLCAGKESLSRVSADDLRRGGLDPAALDNPQYVPLAPFLDDVERFDAGFFGYTSLEAKLMDPQQRLFLECAWEAFEHAGYLPEAYRGTVGVFTGAKTNTYLLNLFANSDLFRKLDHFQIALGNDLACMATRVSYKVGLQGPSYAVHTACSTSLVTVHLACQSLLLGECDMALAGGAAINVPQRRGYLYQKGGILSPDGHCRTFDENAQGSNFGNGVGAVVLKRLADALADRDRIWAVIRGSAVNNDGAHKASYTAPGVEGQTRVLMQAMATAGVDAESISYIEAHGTATDLGDSIEMLALTNAFRSTAKGNHFCAIGSVKTNIGHLETAAGIAGLIKTALALYHKRIPPSLHFERPNPKIDFSNSPFYVNTNLSEWKSGKTPRRAGVSSFGIGSTNAHVVLEEAPEIADASPARPYQLLLHSTRSESSLDALTGALAKHFRAMAADDQGGLADAAYTLNTGRKSFAYRRALVCSSPEEAASALESLDPARVFTNRCELKNRPVVFLFPGLGDQYPNMGWDLYRSHPAFRKIVDRGAELLLPHLQLDIREILFPAKTGKTDNSRASRSGLDIRSMLRRGEADDAAGQPLNQTYAAQPAIFLIEYALANLWMEWGIRPQAMVGYSLGEYVAACLSGVLSFEDALVLVARRALMIQELPPGAMLAVPLPETDIRPLLKRHGVCLAAINGPSLCIISGTSAGVQEVADELSQRQIITRRLQTSHAFHSTMMQPLAERLTRMAEQVNHGVPQIPFISNANGTWFTRDETLDSAYWARHMVSPVRFDTAIHELLKEKERIFLEVGPGQGLTSFLKQHPLCTDEAAQLALASLPGAFDRRPELEYLLEAAGKLWLIGQSIDWQGFYKHESRHRVPLPTYPFERQRYWVDPPEAAIEPLPSLPQLDSAKQDLANWFYEPVWRPAPYEKQQEESRPGYWLLFSDASPMASLLGERIRGNGHSGVTIYAGDSFTRTAEHEFRIRPAHPEDYSAVFAALGRGTSISKIVHFWSVSGEQEADSVELVQERGFYSLIHLAQALGKHAQAESMQIEVVTNHLQSVAAGDQIQPEKATILGPVRVIPQEFPNLACRCIDIDSQSGNVAQLCDLLLNEFHADTGGSVIAYRKGQRWTCEFEPRQLSKPDRIPAKLREGGVYLITGGTGGLGLVLAEHLAEKAKARLILTGRSGIPVREQWPDLARQQDAMAEKIRALQRIEADGGEVLILAADSSDDAQMARVVEQGLQRFGEIHGVIHMAGVPGGGIIQLKTRDSAQRILDPKVRGTLVLEKVFAGRKLDFFVLYSSIASVLGEVGQADYCGASAFLDAYAHKNAAAGKWPTIAINWEIWQEVGIGVNTQVPEHIREWRQKMLSNGILPAEGVDAFERILASGLTQVIVSPQELKARIQLGKSLTAESFLKGIGNSSTRNQPAHRLTTLVAAGAGLEQRISEIWQRILGRDQIGVHDNFFDLGGNSLLGLQLVSELSQELGTQIAPVTLFEFPTIRSLSRHLSPAAEEEPARAQEMEDRRRHSRQSTHADIAIIAAAGRFPGAGSIEELWQNLRDGKETVSFFSDAELLAAGADPAAVRNPRYVRAASVLENTDHFDASLFGYAPREAEVMDPQHRIFLECAWEVLERAGYNPHSYPGLIGVFAGANLSTYLLKLYSDSRVKNSVNHLQALIGNDKDSLTTTVSYKLNLRGPSIAVQTFCSTSLVAVHMACRSLRQGECDMALAGGIRVVVPERQGYVYEPGGLWPADGHTRSFDAKANGSPFGNGVGIVCLKGLEDAIADGDHIEAVIKGTAINNDGAGKAGYTAPSVRGQSAVIQAALEDAGIDPETIGYVEAHGSATELGDPIEISALSKAFAAHTDKKRFCPIGSVKSNFGHLDRAAGVTALIKTTLALKHRQIPPSINFEQPNPNIDFENSPFFVNTTLREWAQNGTPRRAGVNSLGVGGTNVHVIVEEAPTVEPSGPSRPWQLLMMSGKSEEVLDQIGTRLASHLTAHPEISLADTAYTLQTGRKPLEYRRIAVCRDMADAQCVLAGRDPKRLITGYREEAEHRIVFMFPGVGAHYAGMARGLYQSEPIFKNAVDRCCELLVDHLGFDLRNELYPEKQQTSPEEATTVGLDLRSMVKATNGHRTGNSIDRTDVSQPLLFVVEYALAQLWIDWGIKPQAMIGYSLGEYVAACLAGVISVEDALRMVAARARMIQGLAPGALLAVALAAAHLTRLLPDDLSIMAVNGPEHCVVSGPLASVEILQTRLQDDGVPCRRLQASHAFHSRMMQPLFDETVNLARGIQLHAPQIPYISNVTGTWLSAEDAVDPAYWARHMCQSVQFADGIQELLKTAGTVFLEMGPPTLCSFVMQNVSSDHKPCALSCIPHSYENKPDVAHALECFGKLWLLGVEPDWNKFYAHEKRHRVQLPPYPFQRQRYWIETRDDHHRSLDRIPGDVADGNHWFYLPSWKQAPLAGSELRSIAAEQGKKWWVFADRVGLAEEVVSQLTALGAHALRFPAGPDCELPRILNICESQGPPDAVLYLAGVGAREEELNSQVLALLGATLGQFPLQADLPLWVVCNHVHEITGDEELQPQKAGLLGTSVVLSRKFPLLQIRSIDVLSSPAPLQKVAEQIIAETRCLQPERSVAYRNRHRWTPTLAIAKRDHQVPPLRDGGVYLLVNPLNSLGHQFALYLARNTRATLVIAESQAVLDRELWDQYNSSSPGTDLMESKISRLRELEKAAQLLCASAPFCEPAAPESIVNRALQEFGRLDGVLYFFDCAQSAGQTTHTSLLELDALSSAVAERDLDFRLLISSITSTDPLREEFGVPFLFDAFAARSARQEPAWTSITWLPQTGGPAHDDAIAAAFNQTAAPNLIVSPEPLGEGWNKLAAMLGSLQQPEAPAQASNYPRPNLRVAYAPPSTETEQQIAQIWRDLLGLKEIGIHDNFLDLGGDSLMATRLVSRMKDVFQQDVPVRVVFESSTIAELARAVDEVAEKAADSNDVDELMEMLEQLSEEEVEQELLRRRQSLAQGA